jgi:hypothetical protein
MQSSIMSKYFSWLPAPLRKTLNEKYLKFHGERVRRRILDYYSAREKTAEEAEVIGYLSTHPIHAFPYKFIEKYSFSGIAVKYDAEKELPYSIYHDKHIYYPRDMPDDEIRSSVLDLLIEQDPASPHHYLTTEVHPSVGDVVADIGAAEGNFSLDVVEEARRLYLFEPESRWHEPLQATFEPWSEKVVIVPAIVSDVDDNGCLSLDRFFEGKEPEIHFLKVDVEGEERRVIAGARKILTGNHHQKGVICIYHRQDDGPEIRKELEGLGFSTSFSAGYMLQYWDKQLREPYLRRGLIRFTRGMGV